MTNAFFDGVSETNWMLIFDNGTTVTAEHDETHQTITIEAPEGGAFPWRAFDCWYFPFGLSAVLGILTNPDWTESELNSAMEEEEIDKL